MIMFYDTITYELLRELKWRRACHCRLYLPHETVGLNQRKR